MVVFFVVWGTFLFVSLLELDTDTYAITVSVSCILICISFLSYRLTSWALVRIRLIIG